VTNLVDALCGKIYMKNEQLQMSLLEFTFVAWKKIDREIFPNGCSWYSLSADDVIFVMTSSN
jgi:hypothetical protein